MVTSNTNFLPGTGGRKQHSDLPECASPVMETAVETIAIEVERISEAQRFTVALLSERIPSKESDPQAGRGALSPVLPITTPH